MKEILSPQNEELKRFVRLKDEPSASRFFLEGPKFVRDLPSENLLDVFYTDDAGNETFLRSLPPAVGVYRLGEAAMKKLSETRSGQTLACFARAASTPLPEKVVLLDCVQDPGNVGTILRTAYAFGFGVLLSEGCANPFSPKAAVASAGAFARVYTETNLDLAARMNELQAQGYVFYATSPRGEQPPESANLPPKRGFVIGNEGQGICPAVFRAADGCLTLPMENPMESLNAAAASAILTYLFR